MWIFISVTGLIGGFIVIGFIMPVRYEGTTEAEFNRSMQEVWDALQNVNAHPMTGKMMKSVELLPSEDGKPMWKEDMGRGEIITVRTIIFETPHHMIREMSSASVNMTSRWEYNLESEGDSCRITLSGFTDIKVGTWHTPIFRIMMVLGGGVKKGLDIQLDMVTSTLRTEAVPTDKLV